MGILKKDPLQFRVGPLEEFGGDSEEELECPLEYFPGGLHYHRGVFACHRSFADDHADAESDEEQGDEVGKDMLEEKNERVHLKSYLKNC